MDLITDSLPTCAICESVKREKCLWRKGKKINYSLWCVCKQQDLSLSLLGAVRLLSPFTSHLSAAVVMCFVAWGFSEVQTRTLTAGWVGECGWVAVTRGGGQVCFFKFHDIPNSISNTICSWMAHYWIMLLSFISSAAQYQCCSSLALALCLLFSALFSPPLQLCTWIMGKEWWWMSHALISE